MSSVQLSELLPTILTFEDALTRSSVVMRNYHQTYRDAPSRSLVALQRYTLAGFLFAAAQHLREVRAEQADASADQMVADFNTALRFTVHEFEQWYAAQQDPHIKTELKIIFDVSSNTLALTLLGVRDALRPDRMIHLPGNPAHPTVTVGNVQFHDILFFS